MPLKIVSAFPCEVTPFPISFSSELTYLKFECNMQFMCIHFMIFSCPFQPGGFYWFFFLFSFFQIITYESPRGGVSVITKKEETTTSFLLIKNARPSDSGQYQCNPSNAKSRSVTVHVLNGKYPQKVYYFLDFFFIHLFYVCECCSTIIWPILTICGLVNWTHAGKCSYSL